MYCDEPCSFHLGETDTGAAFSACYPGFSDVQVAYADFSKKAIGKCLRHESDNRILLTKSFTAHDENMLALESANLDMSAKTPINSEPSEETDKEDKDQVTQDEEDKDQNDEGEKNVVGDVRMEWLNDSDLYHIGPHWEVGDAFCTAY